MSQSVRLQLGKYYRLTLATGLVYEFKFVGGDPINGELIDGVRIDIYNLMNGGYISIEEIPCLR